MKVEIFQNALKDYPEQLSVKLFLWSCFKVRRKQVAISSPTPLLEMHLLQLFSKDFPNIF